MIIYSSQLVLCVQEVVTPFYIVTYYIKWGNYFCVQEVVTPFYIVTYYIKWGNYFLDTWYMKRQVMACFDNYAINVKTR